MWKKILKVTGIVLLLLLVIVLIVGLIVPREFKFERSVFVKAPVDSVWNYTGTLAGLDAWSPWNAYDPKVKKTFAGKDGEPGACQSWESEIIGSGSQTIEQVQKPTLLAMKLDFMKPHESHGKAYVRLEAVKDQTRVSWGMTGSMPYPMNVMLLFMNMEKMMGKDFDNGLSKLKHLVEKSN